MLNSAAVESKLQTLLCGGAKDLGVVADFDRTLTSATSCSAHGVMERVTGTSDEYKRATQANTAKFYPIEIDPKLTIEQKLPYMREWYESNHAAMVDASITSSQIDSAILEAPVIMRDGSLDLLSVLQTNAVPLIVFSAGLADIIERILNDRFSSPLPPTIRVVSNRMSFSSSGLLESFSEPLIHMFNKSQAAVPPSEQLVRKNQILLGDGYGDRTMCDGAFTPPETLLKIGFLNDHVKEKLEDYKEAFDVVIVEDGSMDVVVDIVRAVIMA